MTETVSVNGGKGLLFLTVHNEEAGSEWSNPHSLLLADKLWWYYDVKVVSTPEEYKPSDKVVVPLFDRQVGLHRFSLVRKEAREVPLWAKTYSTAICVAVSPRCVTFAGVVKTSARQIAKTFAKSTDPLLEQPTPILRSDRKFPRAWRATFSRWPRTFWR